jgi:predicted permease
MDKIAELWRRARFYFRRRRFTSEIEEEMRIHLDLKSEELMAAGMSPEDARLAARREFGNALGLRERAEDAWAFGALDALVLDVRFAVRTMRRAPAFTAVAVLTLALGIGVNTAAFSVVRAVLLAPLPFPAPDDLVAVSSENEKSGDTSFGVSGADFLDLRRDATSFSAMGIYSGSSVTVEDGDRLETISALRVSDGFFEALGVAPVRGRVFAADEYRAGAAAAVISYDLWQNRFGGDPNVVGAQLNGPRSSLTVVGVMPQSFDALYSVDVWRPLNLESSELKVHSDRYFGALARLAPGVEMSRAEEELRAGAERLGEAFPVSNANWSVRLKSLRETLVGDARPALVVLFVATLLVLFIAAANVAHLLLARATARLGEITIRSALGASRGRLVRQLVTENLILSLAGGALGGLGAVACVRSIVALVPADLHVERLDEASVDLGVFAFALAVSVATAVVFAFALAFKGLGTDVSRIARGERTATSGRGLMKLRGVLVSAEVALTIVLAVGAGLLLKSLVNLGRVDLGFAPERLVAVRVASLQIRFEDDDQRSTLYQRFVEAVREVPGVEGAWTSANVPFQFTLNFPYRIDGESQFGDAPDTAYNPVSPGYFREMRLPIREGREFDERDRAGSAPVAVINEAMRRRHFAGVDAVGRRITLNYRGDAVSYEIVGVAGDVKQYEIGEQPTPQLYVPMLQYPWLDTALLVRAKGDPAQIVPAVQKAIRSIDASQTGTWVTTFDQIVTDKTARPRFLTMLLGGFAALALLLAAIGVFGVVSYTVAQRRREIGIRIALGADGSSVTRMVVARGMALVLVGIAPGLACAYALARFMETLLFGVSGLDPTVLAGTAALLCVVALLACLIPARRAAAVDPMTALRQE